MMRSLCVLALVLAGCGGQEPHTGGPGSGGGGAAGGEPTPSAGADLPCPAGELQLEDESCAPPGVPADGCAPGFSHADAACFAVLPAQPCGPGTYALPGETTCHGVGTAPASKWGDITVGSDTQYVDASFGGASNGSEAAPWTTLQQAVSAAAAGAVIAVAAGSYGAVFIDRAVTLWGVGASAVSIDGATGPAVQITGVTATVRGVALTGDIGVFISNGPGVMLREVHIHDTAGNGIYASGTSDVTVEQSLVENATEMGIAAPGGDVALVDSVIRDIAPSATGEWGVGLLAWSSLAAKQNIVVRRSIIERGHSFGINVQDSSDTLVEDSLVRDIDVTPMNGTNGIAIAQWWEDGDAERASLAVTGSVLEGVHAHGIVVWGGDAVIERVTVRDVTHPDTTDEWGAGIGLHCNDAPGITAPIGIVRQTTVDEPHRVGVELWGADAELERVLVRRPRMKTNGEHGFGVLVSGNVPSDLGSALVWRGGRIEDAHQGGLTVMGSTVSLDSVAVLNTHPNESGAMGVGIAVITDYITTKPATGDASRVVVDGAHAGGIVVGGGDLTLSDVLVRNIDKQINIDDFGDGIGAAATIVWIPGYIPTTLSVTRATVEGVPRAGVSSFGASVSIQDTLLECNGIHLDGELLDEHPFSFDDLGHNDCGCGDTREDCKVLTSNLAPPFAL